jgi:hypothetical protein
MGILSNLPLQIFYANASWFVASKGLLKLAIS